MKDTVSVSAELSSEAVPRHFRLIYIGLMLVMLMSALDQTIVSTALPTVVGELHGLSHMVWVTVAYIVAATIAMPVSGRLGDLIGRKALLITGIVLFAVGSAVAAGTPDMLVLVIGRAIQGLGGGSLMITAQAIVADLVPARRRAQYLAPIGVMFTLASVAGPLLGGWFTDTLGWRWCFWINLPISALALVVGVVALKLPPRAGKLRVDYLGIAAMTVAVACTVLVAQWGGSQYAWSSPLIIALTVGALTAWALLVLIEKRAAEPILPLKVFRSTTFVLSTAIGLIAAGMGVFAVVSYMPTYLQMVYGHSATISGLLMLPMILGVTVTSFASGRMISRSGRYKPYPIIGTALMGVALLLMSQMDTSTPVSMVCGYLLLLGGGAGLLIQNLVLIAQNAFPAHEVGTATASNNFFREIGATIGTALVGAAFTSRLATELNARLNKVDVQAIGDVNSLTPATLKSLPATVHQTVVVAYQHAFTPILRYLLPLIAIALAMAVLLPEQRLSETPSE